MCLAHIFKEKQIVQSISNNLRPWMENDKFLDSTADY